MSRRFPIVAAAWTLCATWAALAGWFLSLAGQLSFAGYAGSLLALAAAAVLWARRQPDWRSALRLPPGKRFRRPLPALFLVVSLLAGLGGVLYAPNNYDALTYRVPRLLHWLDAGGWHWIVSPNLRMNLAAANTEWLLAPGLVFFKSDRLLFLASFISFVLLPGRCFAVAVRLGVRPRLAALWMWLLPLGHGYVMQAASLGNDLLGTFFGLAAVEFALRAARTGTIGWWWLGGLATALLSGTKTTNLPLVLPALVALLPGLRLVRQRPVASLLVGLVALVVSFLPTAVANHRFTGHWSGDPSNELRVQVRDPVAGILGNGLAALAFNFAPPILPAPRLAEQTFDRLVPVAWRERLAREYPRFSVRLGELPQEEASGLGLGVAAVLLLTLVIGQCSQGRSAASRGCDPWALGVLLSAGVAVAAYFVKAGSESAARLLLPFYPLLVFAVLRWRSDDRWQRTRPGRALILLAAASALIGLVLTPSRPLWPALTFLGSSAAAGVPAALRERMAQVYATYRARNDLLAPLRLRLPAAAREVAVVFGDDDSEYALWRPLGSRSVHQLFDGRKLDPAHLARWEWVIVKESVWNQQQPGIRLHDWIASAGGRVAEVVPVVSRVSSGADNWVIANFPSAASRR